MTQGDRLLALQRHRLTFHPLALRDHGVDREDEMRPTEALQLRDRLQSVRSEVGEGLLGETALVFVVQTPPDIVLDHHRIQPQGGQSLTPSQTLSAGAVKAGHVPRNGS